LIPGPFSFLYGQFRDWGYFMPPPKPCSQGCSNSAHEPQNAVVDYQALTHFEVHGRNARNTVSGQSHYGDGSQGRARHSVRAVHLQVPQDRCARSDALYQPDKMRIAAKVGTPLACIAVRLQQAISGLEQY